MQRFFVVARDTEDYGHQLTVFSRLEEAALVYEEAAYVVRNAPGEGATNDPTIVVAAALFVADAADEGLAKAMAADGRAFLMEREEWLE